MTSIFTYLFLELRCILNILIYVIFVLFILYQIWCIKLRISFGFTFVLLVFLHTENNGGRGSKRS